MYSAQVSGRWMTGVTDVPSRSRGARLTSTTSWLACLFMSTPCHQYECTHQDAQASRSVIQSTAKLLTNKTNKTSSSDFDFLAISWWCCLFVWFNRGVEALFVWLNLSTSRALWRRLWWCFRQRLFPIVYTKLLSEHFIIVRSCCLRAWCCETCPNPPLSTNQSS
jgi:hypothetical protein